ncbi:glycoside hydrolase family 13 protein [Halanaerobacter jeridensis]|uniref:Oligo-1,6-glucosidase n=1 Tax=Halanaerobacter jeridensis TaxID=706427 RepID=A0A939BPT1_9FIRM|nr:alpha-glucosidase [Halanaerobacter jeridensis]MBM7557437.1 oligo-1,6-glucosidase [Halanaerobacter jeridensis]
MNVSKEWWKEAVVYQIYTRSFNDTNGDGIGDLQGIIEKADYLNKLGIDVVWLNPVYQSPNDDNGYDISDYQDIMDDFGTLEDWEELLEALHQRGIKLIMDLVVNHTSDEHEWFLKSKSSKDSDYRDYYYWRPGQDGNPPNNWGSFFDDTAWDYDEATEEYYLHLFSKKQPDLNWRNPEVREEVYEMMTWWLDKGIDGFRMDVINMISKPDGLPDGEEGPGVNGFDQFVNGPRVHEYLKEMNQEVLSNYDIMTVGETPGVSPKEGAKYVGEDRDELNMVFQFEHVDIDVGPDGKWGKIDEWQLTDLKEIMSKWQYEMEERDGWNSLYLNNHDQPRMVSRFGDDEEYRRESAKMLATFLHTLQGTPYIYQGEEIGMTNCPFQDIEEVDDIETVNNFEDIKESAGGYEEAMEVVRYRSRDHARTPMQWNDSQNAGFTTGEPWLKVNPNYTEINVESALEDEESVFHYYQQLIELRDQYPILVYGQYELILDDDQEIYAYTRTLEDEQLLVILNFFDGEPEFDLPSEIEFEEKELLISNYDVDEAESIEHFLLQPYEARVYKLK